VKDGKKSFFQQFFQQKCKIICTFVRLFKNYFLDTQREGKNIKKKAKKSLRIINND